MKYEHNKIIATGSDKEEMALEMKIDSSAYRKNPQSPLRPLQMLQNLHVQG